MHTQQRKSKFKKLEYKMADLQGVYMGILLSCGPTSGTKNSRFSKLFFDGSIRSNPQTYIIRANDNLNSSKNR